MTEMTLNLELDEEKLDLLISCLYTSPFVHPSKPELLNDLMQVRSHLKSFKEDK